MITYWVKTPAWLKKLFPKALIWEMPATQQPTVYITFDDGPHPTITPFVLQQLAQHSAIATFFCIGKNVVLYPEIYNQLITAGHTAANHTHNHLNGWKTNTKAYLDNINTAAQHIQSRSFRPPYGKISRAQVKRMMSSSPTWHIYMWTVLSADFDTSISPQQCLDNVLKHIKPGAIIVFHDSDKAWERMSHALPQVLKYCSEQKWLVKGLPKN